MAMQRPKYQHAVQWIALEDSHGDDSALDVDAVARYITTALVADLWGVLPHRVATDVVKFRKVTADYHARMAKKKQEQEP